MSLHVLDTDSLTLLLHGHAEIGRRAASCEQAELALTIVTVEETLTGWYSQIRVTIATGEVASCFPSPKRSPAAIFFCRQVCSRDRRRGAFRLS